jgi:hypothetical protein
MRDELPKVKVFIFWKPQRKQLNGLITQELSTDKKQDINDE